MGLRPYERKFQDELKKAVQLRNSEIKDVLDRKWLDAGDDIRRIAVNFLETRRELEQALLKDTLAYIEGANHGSESRD
jgi:hypothetical protein